MSDLVRLTREDDVAVITIDNPPVNALGADVSDGLASAIDTVASDASVRAVVVICTGKTFVAGADIKELEDIASGKGPAGGPDMHNLLASREDCPKPVVMAMHGTALGGGLELAMAGHYRLATPDARMGQPEVNLGIIPGAEGSQRLPRLVGIPEAIDMCVGGRPVPAPQALKLGLIDQLIEGDLLRGAIRFVRQAADTGLAPKTRERTTSWDLPGRMRPHLKQAAPRQRRLDRIRSPRDASLKLWKPQQLFPLKMAADAKRRSSPSVWPRINRGP